MTKKTKHQSKPSPSGSPPRKPFAPQGKLALRRPLTQTLLERLKDHHGISPGQRIGVAVSGGADSVALLRLLLEPREQLGIVLSVAHFNHQLRGKASDGDERFVAKLAARHGLPFFVARENVAAKAKQQRANLEETARRSRYSFFERLVAERHVDRVAVAHTADDQAETVLSHMLRGTGIAGLGGIHPEAGVVFRPLLKFRRAELRAYLRSRNQPWREDATNRDKKRTRARIRAKLIPFLEKQFQPAVVEHLCQLADLARADEGHLNFSANMRVAVLTKKEGNTLRILLQDLLGPPRKVDATESEEVKELRRNRVAMVSRMIRQMVKSVKPRAGQLSSIHVDAVLRLAQLPDSGKSLHLPGGVEVRRERDSLLFRALDNPESRTRDNGFAYALDLSQRDLQLPLLEHTQALRFQMIDWPPQGRETKSTGAVLDRDKLVEPLVLRNWQPGDAMQPLGHHKRYTLSRLLNETGISRWEKVFWPVLTSGGKIAWCRGLPPAAEFAPGEPTRLGVVITEVARP
jgi:tRNA(Ile)-lysidine synthase